MKKFLLALLIVLAIISCSMFFSKERMNQNTLEVVIADKEVDLKIIDIKFKGYGASYWAEDGSYIDVSGQAIAIDKLLEMQEVNVYDYDCLEITNDEKELIRLMQEEVEKNRIYFYNRDNQLELVAFNEDGSGYTMEKVVKIEVK